MPTPPPLSHDDVDGIAAWTVIRAARELARRLDDALDPLDLSPVEFGVLAQLAAADGLSQADLARAVGVRPQSMTALVAALTERTLIERGADRGRGRHSRIGLTEHGHALLAEAWPVVSGSNHWFGEPAHGAAVVALLQPLMGSARGGPDQDVP